MAINAGNIEYTVSVETQASIDAAQRVNSSLDETERQMKRTDAASEKLSTGMTKLAKAISGVIAVSAIYSQLRAAVKVTAEFNATISNLGALTGLAGAELDKLSDAARRIGATTSLSATQAAEGMRLIGSQVPALLSSTEALEGVTQAAAVLAEAAKTDLPSAAQAIAGAMNQFGIAARDTDSIINTLAAGAKNGASSVEQTAAALAVAGTTAKGAGVSFEEFTALVQTLGQGQIMAAEAGTALRNVILQLDTSVDKNLRPSVVGVGAALRNMEKAVAAGTTTYEKFGIVNKTAADVLLQNIDYFEKTVEAVTATNEAYEQQARNNDNLKTDVQALNSAYEDLQITLGQKLDPTLRGVTQTLTQFLQYLGDASDGASGFEKIMDGVGVAAMSVGAVMAGRMLMAIQSSTVAYYQNTVAAGASAKAAVATAQAAAVSAAQRLIEAQALAKSTVGLSTHAAALKGLAAAELQAKTATDALTAAQARLNGIMTTGARAAGMLRAGLAFLGGPVGVAFLAATAIYQLATSTKEAAIDMANLLDPLDDVVGRLRELDKIAQDTQLRTMAKGVQQLEQEYQALGKSLQGTVAYMRHQLLSSELTTAAGYEAVQMLDQLGAAAKAAASGAKPELDGLYESIKNNSAITEKLRESLLNMVSRLNESGKEAAAAASQYDQVADAMAGMGQDAAAAADGVDTLTDSMRSGSDAAAEYIQKAGRALEDMRDNTAVGKLSRDIRDNAEAWQTATKEQLDAAYGVALATDAYNKQRSTMRKTTTARKGLTDAEREAKKASDDARRGAESNAKVLLDLNEALYQTTLNSRELAQRQLELTLNQYATAEQVENVRKLAGALHDINELEKRRKEFGKDVDAHIRGNVPVLQGGRFDDGTARYEAEREAEERRYAEQLERLREAEELKLEVQGGYDQMRERLYQEHSDRMAEIDRVRLDAQLEQWAGGFGQMASDLQNFASVFGTENRAMFGIAKAAAITQAVIQTYQAATGAYAAMASIPYVGPALGVAAAAAAVGAGMANVAKIRSQQMGGGRQYGGPVGADKYYRVNEGGLPEIFRGSDGNQYLMPNQKGEVVSNKDAMGGGVTVNIIEDASKAGRTEQSQMDAQTVIDIFVSNIMQDGETAAAMEQKYGMATVGR